jgi:cobalt-zinc-cadmium efflux system outer membrane protein
MKSLLLCFAFLPVLAQDPMSLQSFVAGTLKANPEALAQRFNVTSAEAQVSINSLMPDPALTTGVSSKELYGPARAASPTQYSVGLGWTLETGGKRAARVLVAQDGVRKAQADLETFLCDLRLGAENAFVDALKARLVLERKRRTLAGFREVMRLDAIRFEAGDIGGVELAQARVEAQRFAGEVFGAEADLKSAEAALAQLLGGAVAPAGDLERAPVAFTEGEVVSRALLNRVDMVAARRSLQLAESQKRLAKANRWVDLGVNVAVNHTPPIYSTGLEAPMSNSLSVQVSIPLPFSRRQRGELVQADAARSQARLEVQAMEQRTRAEVAGALAQYEAAASQLRTFKDGILQDTDKVLEGIQFSYKRGSATLLEFIEAQRTNNEVHLAYFDALAAHAKALAAIDRISGGHVLLD